MSSDYVLEKYCPSGYIRDEENVCEYSSDYAKCCNTCEGYDYLAEDIIAGRGYVLGESCLACEEITKYKAEIQTLRSRLESKNQQII